MKKDPLDTYRAWCCTATLEELRAEYEKAWDDAHTHLLAQAKGCPIEWVISPISKTCAIDPELRRHMGNAKARKYMQGVMNKDRPIVL